MTLWLCGTATKSLDGAKITFLTTLGSFSTENGVFHHFSTVNKPCPGPIQSFQQQTTENGHKFRKLINNFY